MTNIYRDIEQALMRRDIDQDAAGRIERFISEGHAVQPDWTRAPAWARFWAVSPSGTSYWFNTKPLISEGNWLPTNSAASDQFHYRLPLGYDWRLTLRERPEGA